MADFLWSSSHVEQTELVILGAAESLSFRLLVPGCNSLEAAECDACACGPLTHAEAKRGLKSSESNYGQKLWRLRRRQRH